MKKILSALFVAASLLAGTAFAQPMQAPMHPVGPAHVVGTPAHKHMVQKHRHQVKKHHAHKRHHAKRHVARHHNVVRHAPVHSR
jgi:hypothetical protein